MGNCRRIQSIDPKTGKVVKVYDSMVEAARDLHAISLSQIQLALKYRWKTAHGFKWADASDAKVQAPGRPVRRAIKRMSKKETVKYLMKYQDVMSYAQLSAHTGRSVDELRDIYDEKKLYIRVEKQGGKSNDK